MTMERAWTLVARRMAGEDSDDEMEELKGLLGDDPELRAFYYALFEYCIVAGTERKADDKKALTAYEKHLLRYKWELNGETEPTYQAGSGIVQQKPDLTIKFSAPDHLLKPIDREELKNAAQKNIRRRQPPLPQQLEILLQRLHQPAMTNIAIPSMEGLQMIPVGRVIVCRSDSNYTTLHLKNKQTITASRTLKEIEEMLDGLSFLRVHQSSLVNLDEVGKYVRGEGGYLVMSDGSTVDVARSRKEMLLKKLQPHRG